MLFQYMKSFKIARMNFQSFSNQTLYIEILRFQQSFQHSTVNHANENWYNLKPQHFSIMIIKRKLEHEFSVTMVSPRVLESAYYFIKQCLKTRIWRGKYFKLVLNEMPFFEHIKFYDLFGNKKKSLTANE